MLMSASSWVGLAGSCAQSWARFQKLASFLRWRSRTYSLASWLAQIVLLVSFQQEYLSRSYCRSRAMCSCWDLGQKPRIHRLYILPFFDHSGHANAKALRYSCARRSPEGHRSPLSVWGLPWWFWQRILRSWSKSLDQKCQADFSY